MNIYAIINVKHFNNYIIKNLVRLDKIDNVFYWEPHHSFVMDTPIYKIDRVFYEDMAFRDEDLDSPTVVF